MVNVRVAGITDDRLAGDGLFCSVVGSGGEAGMNMKCVVFIHIHMAIGAMEIFRGKRKNQKKIYENVKSIYIFNKRTKLKKCL